MVNKNTIKMSKKGAVMLWGIMLGLLIVFSLIFFLTFPKNIDFRIGQDQMELVKKYHEADSDLIYLDQTAKIAFSQAFLDLSKDLFLKKEDLKKIDKGENNEFEEYPFLTDDFIKTEILPDAVSSYYFENSEKQKEFENLFNEKFNEIFSEIYKGNIPTSPYTLSFSQNNLIGKSYAPSTLVTTINLITKGDSMKVGKKTYKLDTNTVQKINEYNELIIDASRKYNLDANIIKAVMTQESGGKPHAVSGTGAVGLMQFTSGTAITYGCKSNEQPDECFDKENIISCSNPDTCLPNLGKDDRFDPKKSIYSGAKFLLYLSKRYDNNIILIAISYNAGPGIADKAKNDPLCNDFSKMKECVTNAMEAYCAGGGTDKGICDTEKKIPHSKKIDETSDYALKVYSYYRLWGGGSDFTNKQTDYMFSINPSFRTNLGFDPLQIYTAFLQELSYMFYHNTNKDFFEAISSEETILLRTNFNRNLERIKTERVNINYELDEENKLIKFTYKSKMPVFMVDEKGDFLTPEIKFAYKYNCEITQN